MKIYAVVPARHGSSRFKNKNIKKFLGKELFLHSIFFAKKLKFISKIIFSTDSKKYIEILKKKTKNIEVHNRSKYAAGNNSMEEDILFDLYKYFKNKKDLPDAILWLRPTHPLRCIKTFIKAFKKFEKKRDTVLVVHENDPRLFREKNGKLSPLLNDFKKKSMLRSQGLKPYYSIFSGEYFKFPNKYNKKFLGKNLKFVVAPKLTDFDIDLKDDLKLLNYTVKQNKRIFKNYIHFK